MTTNLRNKIAFKVLTPLSIGAGSDNDWIYGIDYILHEDGNIYIIDFRKAMKVGLPIQELTDALLNQDIQKLRDLFGRDLEKLTKSANGRFIAPLADKSAYMNPIKSFIRTNGNAYVPGSSLKGAIRSAITCYLTDSLQFFYHQGRFKTTVVDERTMRKIDVDVYGSVKQGEDIMRFIQVSDMFLTDTQLLNTKVFNLRKNAGKWEGGWKHSNNQTASDFKSIGFNTIYECALPDAQTEGYITLATNAFAMLTNRRLMISRRQKESLLDKEHGIEQLFTVINRQTLAYLQEELRFFQTYPTDRTREIESSIQKLILETKNAGPSVCVLKMSAGSGHHSIIGNWTDKDFTKDKAHTVKKNGQLLEIPYKSRKIVEYEGQLQLMGFVKLQA